ncbi:E1B 19K [Simian mastadenovirus C]|uniref:E1B protein, small T-antigen n=1 Tax=Simian mastadenovirus C TaxID=1962300 RepID=M9YVF6_9ADEN|nr:E1B 19K [Simian mastadenovirus C]
MDLLRLLSDYEVLRKLLETACEKNRSCWRFFFGSTLSNVVHRVKREHSEEFSRLVADVPGLFVSLDLGHHSYFQEKIVKGLVFESTGRTVVSVAFICFLLDKWSSDSHLSWDYMLDYMTMALWRALLRRRRACIYLPVQPQQGLERVEEEEEENPRAGVDPPLE